ncbi:hypothetical protein [Thermodesulfovibrio hydrogeniphilus]
MKFVTAVSKSGKRYILRCDFDEKDPKTYVEFCPECESKIELKKIKKDTIQRYCPNCQWSDVFEFKKLPKEVPAKLDISLEDAVCKNCGMKAIQLSPEEFASSVSIGQDMSTGKFGAIWICRCGTDNFAEMIIEH